MHFFSLPFSGIKNGQHTYNFSVQKDFLEAMESDLITEGKFNVKIELDRRSSICDLKFFIEGLIPAVCDRCVADIHLPIASEYNMVVKVTPEDLEDTEDILYLKESEHTLILDQIIYELICLSLPLINVYNCEKEIPKPCNSRVLEKLKLNEPKPINPLWEGLENFNQNKINN